jgi:cell division protein FtsN
MLAARRPARRGRVGSFLFTVGCLALLGLTFGAGLFVGRTWPALPGGSARARESATAGEARAARRPPESAPVLTFYQELTAPLTAPPASTSKPAPAPPRPALAPGVPPRDGGAGPVGPPLPAAAAPPPARTDTPRAEPAGPARFTIQVGAFKDRPPAEALRATLALYGHDAYITESSGEGTRFRVRVGAYATRDEARAAAARIAAERHVSTYVTGR